MEKWKLAVIAALVMCIGLYGFAQQHPVPIGPQPVSAQNSPPPEEELAVYRLLGQRPAAWSVPANRWTNTSRPINLNDLRGSVTLIEFWRSGCSHCQDAAPMLAQMYRTYSPRGLKMVSFESPGDTSDPQNPETNWTDVQGFVREHQLPYPVAFDKGGTIFKTSYSGTNYPTVLLLDRQGVVRWVQTGWDEKKHTTLDNILSLALAP